MSRQGNDKDNPTAAALIRQKELEELGVPHPASQASARLAYDCTEATNTLKSQSNESTNPDSRSTP